MTTARTLWIDGDAIVYRSCISAEHEVNWGNDLFTIHSTFSDAHGIFDILLSELMDRAETTEAVFCFSGADNWRKHLWPEYKNHRKNTRKPLVYSELIGYVTEHFTSHIEPTLEADDLLGLLCHDCDENILWSPDKDLKQIPGLHLFDDDVEYIDEVQATAFHMYQTLVGDTADGYKGCPGIGDVRGSKLCHGGWDAVLGAFLKAGLTEEDALLQARLSRILRNDEYDFETKEVRLWTP